MTATTNKQFENVKAVADKMAKFAGKPLGRWGFFLRAAGLLLLVAAATFALVFGAHYGIAYVAGLGLGAGTTLALQIVAGIVAALGVFATGWFGTKWMADLIARRQVGKFGDKLTATVEEAINAATAAA